MNIDLTIPDFLDRKHPVCIALLAIVIALTPVAADAHPGSHHCHVDTQRCH